MESREVKDAKFDGKKIYYKGHAKATYMSDGRNVEEAIHQIVTGGGGGVTEEYVNNAIASAITTTLNTAV